MKNILVFLFVTSIPSITPKRCQGIRFNDRYYEVEIAKEGINNPRQLTYNENDNTVYFVFDLIRQQPATAVGFINLETKETGTIDGIRNPKGVTIDPLYNIVYVGGADGIYRIDNRRNPVKFPVEENNIVSLYLREKDALYFVNSRKEAYKYVLGNTHLLPELHGTVVDSFAIDEDNNIFFLDDKILFRVKVGTRAVNSHEHYSVNFVTTDRNDKAFIGATDAVYIYNKHKYALEKVSDIKDAKGLTFTKFGEPVYATSDQILRLHYKQIPCIE